MLQLLLHSIKSRLHTVAHRLLSEEQGASLVWFALVSVFLFGFIAIAVDGSYGYLQRREMQNAADAAALAGARALARNEIGQIESEVASIAALNGASSSSWGYGSCSDPDITPNTAISVTVEETVDTFFANLLGFSSITAIATAEARYEPVTTASELLPIAVDGCDCVEQEVVERVYSPGICVPTIDFTSDAEGNPLPAGTILNDQWAEWGINITSHNPSSHPPMIFDSGNPTGSDWDLGTPNEVFGGPGRGPGGEEGVGANRVPLGNLMILSEDGDSSDPDDNAGGGRMIFTFDQAVRIDSVNFMDSDEDSFGQVTVYSDKAGNNRIGSNVTRGYGDNSVEGLPIDATNVRRMEVYFPGSGSVSSVVSCSNPAEYEIPQDSCKFSWADWDGGDSSVAELANRLSDPSSSDVAWSIGDNIPPGPSMEDAIAVRESLNGWLNQSAPVFLYDEQDAEGNYNVCGFAEFTLTDYQLQDRLPSWIEGYFGAELERAVTSTDDPSLDYGMRDVFLCQ